MAARISSFSDKWRCGKDETRAGTETLQITGLDIAEAAAALLECCAFDQFHSSILKYTYILCW